jgi:hypothetical protein
MPPISPSNCAQARNILERSATPLTNGSKSHGVDAINLSRGCRDVQKRLSPGVALAKFDLRAWLAHTGGAWSGTAKTGSLLVVLEGDLPWRRDLPGEDI